MESIEEYQARLKKWIDEHKRKKLHTPVLVLDTLDTIPIDNIPIVQPSGL